MSSRHSAISSTRRIISYFEVLEYNRRLSSVDLGGPCGTLLYQTHVHKMCINFTPLRDAQHTQSTLTQQSTIFHFYSSQSRVPVMPLLSLSRPISSSAAQGWSTFGRESIDMRRSSIFRALLASIYPFSCSWMASSRILLYLSPPQRTELAYHT